MVSNKKKTRLTNFLIFMLISFLPFIYSLSNKGYFFVYFKPKI